MEEQTIDQKDPQIPNVHDEHIALPDMKEKEENIDKKQKRFKLIVFSILGIIVLAILISIILFIANFIKNKNKDTFETEEIPETIVNVDITDTWLAYDSLELRLNLKYPNNTKLMENKNYDGSIKNLEIIYTPGNAESITGETLTEGFIFRITPLNLSKNSLDDIASVKRESFSVECGENVQISSTRSDVIYNLDAKTFDVKNCDGDFKVTYVARFGIFYEIAQLYRGDLGFRQQYKSTTEEMIKSLTFHPEDEIEEKPYKIFENKNYDIYFTYPKELTENCCELPEPPEDTLSYIVKLGMKETEARYATFGVFRRPENVSNDARTFNEFVLDQKNTLISDYKIANNGQEPTIVEEQLTIASKQAVWFKGLSWKGNELIYIKVPSDRGDKDNIYVISLVNKIGESFENTFQDILDSMDFTEKN